MKTEEKNAAPRVRIAVLGQANVGKSALTVRYLTKRYIGEYRSDTDLLYRQTVTVNNAPIDVEIVDISGETTDSPLPVEQVEWSDACVLVYSITDRQSFEYAHTALQRLLKTGRPTTLLANKADLEHLRQVEESEGRKAASEGSCAFYEVSAVDNTAGLYQAFDSLLAECRAAQQHQPKARKFSVSKMLGTLIGSAAGKQHPPPLPVGGGTVVEFHKSDLHRTRVLSRRPNFAATASL
ncbi:ras-related and estrogen-regulated growth inhibitor-like protein [Schistocerca piceifrons]|uniref:ras-related and estrogen-regulated growth inhibitor-like protein n=1 Tax=Schistocerca piceifrons TaxID=274613 RepID=UPI001F5EEE81|nr:ras-related and estrogen-regulated growth inhibitor-like protein [Schistocerca piceifrons]XP_049856627.1 ras-related and estrogen-regulated growth inhibitor-like protein [Schistocerca gregaria]XP_049948391.1 ras-related and estrogen-regulated growth inhibitor-like protein [Schistocerca serialis cubense]